jgi:hypothetical protein
VRSMTWGLEGAKIAEPNTKITQCHVLCSTVNKSRYLVRLRHHRSYSRQIVKYNLLSLLGLAARQGCAACGNFKAFFTPSWANSGQHYGDCSGALDWLIIPEKRIADELATAIQRFAHST